MPLSPGMIDQGAAFIRALDVHGVLVQAAFWFLRADNEDWRLYIASPDIRTIGVFELYKRSIPLWEKLADYPEFGLDQVGFAEPSEQVFVAMSKVVITGTELIGRRFANRMVDGFWIDYAYVYRQTLKPPAPPIRRKDAA